MHWVRWVGLVAVGWAVGGCAYPSGLSIIQDHQQYDSGKLKAELVNYHLSKNLGWAHVSAFYENGRLQSDEWTDAFGRLVKLAFYESGRLKSEERFTNGQLTFGAYYTDTGELERAVGDRLAEAVR